MSDARDSSENVPADMEEYLQTFLDETEEQLDDLVDTMLALESNPASQDDLNEAFRLVHSIKGSAGMMGFENMMELAHALETRFERFRSGDDRLDEPTMNLVLRCVDYLRQCNGLLRKREPVESSAELLAQLQLLESPAGSETLSSPEAAQDNAASERETVRIVARFRDGLQLADLKAHLIVRRLAEVGEVHSTVPPIEQIAEVETLTEIEIHMTPSAHLDAVRDAANVDGVESIKFPDLETAVEVTTASEGDEAPSDSRDNGLELETVQAKSQTAIDLGTTIANDAQQTVSESKEKMTKVGETMRVDIERLDNLMNLAGELIVNRARFVQVSGEISPALRKASALNRIRDFSESLRRAVESLQNGETLDDRSTHLQQLRTGLELMDEQIEVLENGRRCLGQISEAIDQLSRVSDNLQRGVLDTRMVPVGPLFNRFKRVVRDIAKERGKQVELQIHGEKTELDKRMIDDLFDPLMHLVRNAIDHGLEPSDVRVGQGKPEVGTISLEAAHSGNNVYVRVRDDGRGIDAQKIRAKLVARQILADSAAHELSDEQVLDYIWHPGFSTSEQVTDVSGRGVGMDVVKTRMNLLNGGIEVESTPQRGTNVKLRLPLTLAIINSLLVQMEQVTFSMPIDDVREIVVVHKKDFLRVSGKQAFEIRGEFIPLLNIRSAFHWHKVDYGHRSRIGLPAVSSGAQHVQVVVLQAGNNTVGLQVDDLLGSQEIVVKSLSNNFVDIHGLSGASILGDGSVCLMLDVGMLIDMAAKGQARYAMEEVQG